MKRLPFHLLAIFGGFFALNSCHKIPPEYAASDKYRLVWNDDPTSTITLIWDQLKEFDAIVYYDTVDHGRQYWKYTWQSAPQKRSTWYEMNTRYLKLTDLEPDKPYYFTIKDDQGLSERYWFRTAPDVPKSITFVIGGDTKSDDEPLEAGRSSNRMVARLRPLFVMFNGDFTSGNGTDAGNWKKWLTDWHQLTTTEDGRMIPLFPVHGNHENGDHGNLSYIFDAPYQHGDSSQIYYSISLGGDLLHLLALNSEIEEGGRQMEWLKKNLSENSHFTFKGAGFHKPFRPHHSGKRENDPEYRTWAFLFHEYGLDFGLDADSHMHKITYPVRPDSVAPDGYQGFVRDDEHGTMYMGEGSWGAHPRANDDDKPWTMVSGSFNQIKWIHMFPEDEGSEAHMKIFTVITADYDENEVLHTYDEGVQALTEDNLFSIPAGINIFAGQPGKNYVTYPYHAE